MPIFEDVSGLLRAARKLSGKSRQQLAVEAKIAKRTLADYEGGKVSPQVEVFDRLLVLCGIETLGALARLIEREPRIMALGFPPSVAVSEVREAVEDLRALVPGQSSVFYKVLGEVVERVEKLEAAFGAPKPS